MSKCLSVAFFYFLAVLPVLAFADLHHFFVGNSDGGNSIYSLEYNDQTSSLSMVKNNSVKDVHPYLAFNHNKKSLYAAGSGSQKFYSYAVLDSTTVDWETAVDINSPCANTSMSHIIASPNWPYTVFGSAYPGPASCGAVLTVDDEVNGTLWKVASNYTYATNSGVYGLAFSPNSYFLYSADLASNSIWLHYVNPNNGELSVKTRLNVTGSTGPSDLLVHRMGLVLYVVMQETNELAVYNLDPNTAFPKYLKSYQLLPDGADSTDYISTGISLSSDGGYLWTTSSSKYDDEAGYVSVFSVDQTTGQVLGKVATSATGLGATSHATTATPFANDLMALTYYPVGIVEVWQVSNTTQSAKAIAKVSLGDSGCCGTGLWFD